MNPFKRWFVLAVLLLSAVSAGAATPEGHYGGTVTAEGIESGHITFKVDKTSVVGTFSCKVGKNVVSIPLQGLLDEGKLSLTAPAKTKGVSAIRIAGEAKGGMFKGSFEGVLRGKKIKGEFSAALASE